MLLANQELIDQAVAVVAATTATQTEIQKHINLTDTKIQIHNTSEEAHDDIREQMASMSRTMLSEPEIEGPIYTETGMENTWVFTANALISSVKVTGYKIIDEEGNEFMIQADAHGVGTFTHAFVGERNHPSYFTVAAMGSYNSMSPSVQFDFTITQHLPPVMDEMEVTLPARVSYGKTYNFSISGITDPDTDLTNISISSNHDDKVTYSQNTNLVQGQTYTFTLANDLKGGELIFTITADDDWDLSSTKSTAAIPINRDPIPVQMMHTLPNHLTPGSSIQARVLAGATDPDDDTLTYDISSSIAGITFSKTSGIALNEDITINTASSVAQGTSYTLTFTFKDQYGGSCTNTVSSTINTLPNVSGMTVMQNALHIPGQSDTITISGATDPNNEEIKYSIQNTNQGITFSKISDISADEEITVTYAGNLIHGNTYNVNFTATDTSGGSSTITVGFKINSLIAAANIVTNIPAIIKPNTAYQWKITTAVDPDNQPLKYSITCSNANVVLSDNTDIDPNTNFTCTANLGTGLARGDTFNLVITASDGMETVTKTVPVKINQLGNPATIAQTGIPSTFKGGAENKTTFKLSGGTEPDSQTFTYNIKNVNANLTIGKLANISASDNIQIQAKKVSAVTAVSFDVSMTDALGEESSTKTISFNINPITVTSAPSITSPTTDQQMPHYDPWNMTWSAYATHADVDEAHVYPWN